MSVWEGISVHACDGKKSRALRPASGIFRNLYVLGSVFETNTLFLLAAASYFVGIVIREFGLRTGAAFYLASVLLDF